MAQSTYRNGSIMEFGDTICNKIPVASKFSNLDFVSIDVKTIGIIVQMGSDSADILTQSNVIVTKPLSHIASKLNKTPPSIDINKNILRVGNYVTILEGPFGERKEEKLIAQIKYIHKKCIFVFSSKYKDNYGYFCANPIHILLYEGPIMQEISESSNFNSELEDSGISSASDKDSPFKLIDNAVEEQTIVASTNEDIEDGELISDSEDNEDMEVDDKYDLIVATPKYVSDEYDSDSCYSWQYDTPKVRRNYEDHIRSGCWATIGLIVKVVIAPKHSRRGPNIIRYGLICDFSDEWVKVKFDDEYSKEIEFHYNENIFPVFPSIGDSCRFVFGNHFQTTGMVKNIHRKERNERECLVQSSLGDLLICAETHLCKAEFP
uniref:DUF663 domain-containing protein n=1 Tax=Rhabditophanes sp. KR3021 TaxID=114890 RepID=A0AC35TPT5_9BILA